MVFIKQKLGPGSSSSSGQQNSKQSHNSKSKTETESEAESHPSQVKNHGNGLRRHLQRSEQSQVGAGNQNQVLKANTDSKERI